MISFRWALLVPIVSSFQPTIPTQYHLSSSSGTNVNLSAEATTTASSETIPLLSEEDTTDDRSTTLTLLEHVNFNVPNHDYILDFYLRVLGCGLDPKVACNLMPDTDESFGRTGLIWATCGPNQFHLPRGEIGQSLPGHIGLRYRSLDNLKKRLELEIKDNNNNKCIESYEIVKDNDSNEIVIIKDRYGTIFYCREGAEKLTQYRHSFVKSSETDKYGDVAVKYGMEEETDCRGIDYVEFNCKKGIAKKIAAFYESVLDVAATVIEEDGTIVALIGFGDVDNKSCYPQYMKFRETSEEIPAYDGHHLAIYVGENMNDFEDAFHKVDRAGIISTNWRDKIDATTIETARQVNQFRFQTIFDIETNETIFELEHEIRSVEFPTFPGKRRK